MDSDLRADFGFALANPGSERALKQEMENVGCGWRPGYQRRGFVTFKADAPFDLAALDVEIAMARRLCLSFGKSATREEARDRLRMAEIVHHVRYELSQMRGIVPDGELPIPRVGQLIGTIVELGAGEFWSGLHRHAPFLSPDPGGDGGLEMPARSPSRAWLKLEEAIRFFRLDFNPRDLVVEIGCAPGGVALDLLDRGVPVIGVDPAKMADVVMDYAIPSRDAAPAGRPWFLHCRKPAALCGRRDLGAGVTWFMSDMNQAPRVVLAECARFCKMAPTIRGALMTLKLTDLGQIADKPEWFAALRGMGFGEIRLQQFSVHRNELALLALRPGSKL